MQKRAALIIIKDNQILLMHRIRDNEEYYVFIGGRQEDNETMEETAVREAKEEVSLAIVIDQLLFEDVNLNTDQPVNYYLVKEFSGTVALGGEEKEDMEGPQEFGEYYPEWHTIHELTTMTNLYPQTARRKLISALNL